jgi:hypothetical protein
MSNSAVVQTHRAFLGEFIDHPSRKINECGSATFVEITPVQRALIQQRRWLNLLFLEHRTN